MKLSLICASAILMLGCAAKPVPPPKPVEEPIHNATAEDCTHVYERILTISVIDQLGPDQTFSQQKMQEAAFVIDQFYIMSGKKDLFFAYCSTRLNVNQTKCMLTAENFDDMDVCDVKFKTKKNP